MFLLSLLTQPLKVKLRLLTVQNIIARTVSLTGKPYSSYSTITLLYHISTTQELCTIVWCDYCVKFYQRNLDTRIKDIVNEFLYYITSTVLTVALPCTQTQFINHLEQKRAVVVQFIKWYSDAEFVNRVSLSCTVSKLLNPTSYTEYCTVLHGSSP